VRFEVRDSFTVFLHHLLKSALRIVFRRKPRDAECYPMKAYDFTYSVTRAHGEDNVLNQKSAGVTHPRSTIIM